MGTITFLAPASVDAPPVVLVGGPPAVESGFEWPHCSYHHQPLTYLFSIGLTVLDPAHDRRMLVWQCTVDPGLCDDWMPFAGCNAAIVRDRGPAGSPTGPHLPRGTDLAGERLTVADDLLSELEENYAELAGERDVHGHAGAAPTWYQDDETPDCPDCGSTMTFVAQLEEYTHDDLNFGGGGLAYFFLCRKDDHAAWLWQR